VEAVLGSRDFGPKVMDFAQRQLAFDVVKEKSPRLTFDEIRGELNHPDLVTTTTPDQLQRIANITHQLVRSEEIKTPEIFESRLRSTIEREIPQLKEQPGKIDQIVRQVTPRIFLQLASRNSKIDLPGGIDFTAEMMKLLIQKDPNGKPLPISRATIEQISIDGLTPEIIEIVPVTPEHLPSLSEYAEKDRHPMQLSQNMN
jgi:hypothetical protein